MNDFVEYQQPNLFSIFSNFKYGRHILILGGIESGKTNMQIHFYKHLSNRNFKCVMFNPIGRVEFIKFSDINLNPQQVFDKKLEKALKHPQIKRICITPTQKYLVNDKNLKQLWNFSCMQIANYEDKVFSKFMNKKYGLKVNKDFKRKSNTVIFNDELVMCCDGENLENWHKFILHTGQNHNISMIGNTQRNQLISKIQTTLSKWKFLFELDRYDTYVLRNKITNINMATDLKPFHFIFVDGNKTTYYKPLSLVLTDTFHGESYVKR